jgi:hypothetical protein
MGQRRGGEYGRGERDKKVCSRENHAAEMILESVKRLRYFPPADSTWYLLDIEGS